MIITGLKALLGGVVLGFFLGQAFTIGDAIKGGTALFGRIMVSFDEDFRRPTVDEPGAVAGDDAEEEAFDKALEGAHAEADYRAGAHRR